MRPEEFLRLNFLAQISFGVGLIVFFLALIFFGKTRKEKHHR